MRHVLRWRLHCHPALLGARVSCTRDATLHSYPSDEGGGRCSASGRCDPMYTRESDSPVRSCSQSSLYHYAWSRSSDRLGRNKRRESPWTRTALDTSWSCRRTSLCSHCHLLSLVGKYAPTKTPETFLSFVQCRDIVMCCSGLHTS